VTSVVATVIGVVLMSGRNTLGLIARIGRRVRWSRGRVRLAPRPHLRPLSRKQPRSARR
jgi:hypothetical protein